MKKILAVCLMLLAVNASAVNFTNNVKYKIELNGIDLGPVSPADDLETGSWQSYGRVSFTLPVAAITNLPEGVSVREMVMVALDMSIIVTASEVASANGTNEIKRINNALKSKVRQIGVKLAKQLP